MRRGCMLIVVAMLAGACGREVESQGATASPPDDWQRYVESRRSAFGVPALGVAAADRSQLLFAAVAGVRDIGSDAPATAEDPFHIGSVTKPMTATLIARLVESGTMDWQTTPADIWPTESRSFVPSLRRITVEQLLGHRAGMPSFETDEENETFPRHDESSREERARFAMWLLEREPAFPVGEHVYSNAGYGLVVAMAEHVTGTSWEELTRREVFSPLGLQSCGFGWPVAPSGHLKGHWMRDGRLQVHDLSDGYRLRSAIAPAGDIHCSVADLARFGQAHLRGLDAEGGYLTRATFEKLHDAPHGEYALGWNVRPFGSHHLGSAGTFEANLILFRDYNLVTAVVTNSGGTTSDEFSSIASDLYYSLRTSQ